MNYLLRKKQAIMSVLKKSILPNRYQELEYIESSGTQAIDTGYIINENTKIDCKFNITQDTASYIFGVGMGTISNIYQHVSSKKFCYNTTFADPSTIINNLAINTDIEYILDITNGKIISNNTEYTFTKQGTLPLYSCILFGVRYSRTTLNYFSSLKLYKFKIYENGVLIKDFVPCYRKSDNEIGLYDVVNGVFHTNQGTGTFSSNNV